MIDDTVKSIIRGARDAKTLDECNVLRVRVDAELGDGGTGFACLMAIREREDTIIASYKFDIANEVP